MSKRPRPQQPAPTAVIQNCTFSDGGQNSECVLAIARALEANAKALNSLADNVARRAPMIQIGLTEK